MNRRCPLAAAVLLAILSSVALADRPVASDVEKLLAEAEALNSRGAFRDTITLLSDRARDASVAPLPRARLLCHLALAQAQTAQYDEALGSAGEAEQLARPAGQQELLARVEIVRGVVAMSRVGPVRAIDHFTKAATHATTAGHASVLATAYSSLGNASQVLGDWSRVLYYAERAWETKPGTDYLSRYRYAILRGIAYYEFGELEIAEARFNEGLALAEAANDRHSISLALGELGLVHSRSGAARETALNDFDRAIAFAREAGSADLEVSWLLNSGNIFRDAGDGPGALRRYRQALALEEKTGQRRNRSILLKNIGQTLARDGEPVAAERYLLDAMAEADRQNAFRIRWESRMELGVLYRASDAAKADQYFRESLDLIEQHHSNVLLEGFRAAALGRALAQYDPYDQYIDFLLERGDEAAAFDVAERSRARTFLESLTAARDQLAAAAPAVFVDAERDLLKRISSTQATVRTGPPDAGARDRLLKEIAADEEALTALRIKLAAERPALAQARYPRIWTLDDLRGTLRGDEVVFEVFLGRRTSAAWMIGRDRIEVLRLPARGEIEQQARAFLDVLRTPGGADRPAGMALFRSLRLDRVMAAAEARRLVVVPHGILHYVPFEALVTPDGRYVVEERAVSYAPSASSLAFLRSTPPTRSARAGTVVAIGDPVLALDPAGGSAAAERGMGVDRMNLLKPLAHAAKELREVAAIFGGAARLLVKEDATEDRLDREDLGTAAILHLATHGLIDEQRPERSALALTATPPASDGILQMREVYRLKLNASLVTLSACQTALGKEVNGEGIVSLARAFFYAGTRAVMASLWNINDASTAQYMTHFYARLRQGDAIDEAARAAKLALLRHDDERLRHPYHWAAFTVSGHAAVPVPIAGRSPVLLAVVVLAMLVAGAALYSAFRPHRR